jgi:hypothetical protein
VAATVAAPQNGAGVVGVAPAARIMPLRVLDANGQGSSADVAAAFAFAAERGVRVVNASLGSEFESQAERRAVEDHPGTLFVVASGNGGADSAGDDVDGATREYPCAHAAPNVVCVGATDQGDALATFSNYGATSVDLFAPGTAVVSAVPLARASHLDRYFGTGPGYEIMQGTSMAAPHAAGVAALAAGLPVAKRAPPPRPRPPSTSRPSQLVRLERIVEQSGDSGLTAHTQLRPLLSEIAEARLARRAVQLSRDLDEARRLLGPDAWELVRPDRPEPPDRRAPGVASRELRAVLDSLEAL